MVRPIAARLHRVYEFAELEDLISVGTIALIQAHDSGRIASRMRIKGAMLDSIRANYRFTAGRSELVDRIDTQPTPQYALADLLYYLPMNCRELLRLRLKGYSRRAAARLLEISPRRARTLEMAAIERLRVLCKKAVTRSSVIRRAA